MLYPAPGMCFTTAAGTDAQLLVPRALGLLAGSPQAPRDEWAAGWERVPLHVLLPWGAQMLSLLDGMAGDALLPTLKVSKPRCPIHYDFGTQSRVDRVRFFCTFFAAAGQALIC